MSRGGGGQPWRPCPWPPRRSRSAPPPLRSPTGGAADPRAMRAGPARSGAAPLRTPSRGNPSLPCPAVPCPARAGSAQPAAGEPRCSPGGARPRPPFPALGGAARSRGGSVASTGCPRRRGRIGPGRCPGARSHERGAGRPRRVRPAGVSGGARSSGPAVTALCVARSLARRSAVNPSRVNCR